MMDNGSEGGLEDRSWVGRLGWHYELIGMIRRPLLSSVKIRKRNDEI